MSKPKKREPLTTLSDEFEERLREVIKDTVSEEIEDIMKRNKPQPVWQIFCLGIITGLLANGLYQLVILMSYST